MLKTVLILLCLSNLLNVVLPRYAVDSGILGLPIQMISVVVLGITVISAFSYKKVLFNKFFKSVRHFLLYAFLTLLIYVLFASIDIEIISNILRAGLWFCSLLFFSKYGYQAMGKYKKYMQFFIITFLAAGAKKVFESADFDAEKLIRGDFAGLTLVLVIPSILLFFKNRYQTILLIITIVLVLATIRRSAIIALCAVMPFVFFELKSKLKPQTLLFLIILFIGGVAFAWEVFGTAVTQRFATLLQGDNSYQYDESYGSGRSIFYLIILDSWWQSKMALQIFGHGLSSVRDLLREEYNDIGHAHNDYLESLYIFGVVGLMLYCNILYRIVRLRKVLKIKSRDKLNIYYITFISFIIISLSSGTFYRAEMIVFSIPLGVLISNIESETGKTVSRRKLMLQV